jgi:LysR family transcriptional regulator, regulator for metE and metH
MDPMDIPSVVEMRHLRLVAAIAATGGVTAAARALHLTQPALSHQLRELETRLRTPLFVRTSRRMVATPAGEQLAHLARSVLADVHGFEREVLSGHFSEARGSIRIATACYTVYHWLPAVLKAFRDRWPSVDLRIAPEYTGAPLAALRDGTLDLAIVHQDAPDKRLRFEPLFDDELVVVTAPDHRLARNGFVTAEDFEPEHLILYATQDGDPTVVRELLNPAGVVPRRVTRIQLTEAIIQLVAAGLGIAVMARWAVMPALRAGAIRAVRLTEHGFLRKWCVGMRADDPCPAYRVDLLELLRRHVAAGPVIHEARIA